MKLMNEKIIKTIGKFERIKFKELRKALNIPNENIDYFREMLHSLEVQGKIYFDENNYYTEFPINYKVATLNSTKSKVLFIESKGNGKIIINPEKANGALIGDKVVVELSGNGKKSKGEVKKILERQNDIVVCEVVENEGIKHLIPFNVIGDLKLRIDHQNMKRLVPGQRITVRLSDTKNDDVYEAYFIEVIGNKNDPDVDLKCIALSHGFNFQFSDDALKQLEEMPTEVEEKDLENRVDLRNEMIYTIDGKNCKDMDDAISVKKLSNGHYIVSVHISHVSNYIKTGTPLFEEAQDRTTSVYFIDYVIPMLPAQISNGICSLNPNVDRLTRTIDMEIDENGEVVWDNIYLSVINSKKKMAYEDINEMFNTGEIPNGYERFANNIYLAREINKKINLAREKRGSINFYSSELEVDIDKDGKVENIDEKYKGEAENIIENFMLLANERIANYSEWLNIPFVYRNHDIPDEDKVIEAVRFIRTLGFRVKCLDNTKSPKVLQKILKTLSCKEEFPILSDILLSSMCRAQYSTANSGHYGLALNEYTHYTSPIRRLPDLLVHTLLDYFENYNMSKNELKSLEDRLQKLCERSSLKEREADAVEENVIRLKSLEYIEQNLGMKFCATITGISPSFMKIKTDSGIEGKVMIDDIIGDKYILNKSRSLLKGKNSGNEYKVGDKIKVTAKSVSKPELEIYFYAGSDKELKYMQRSLNKRVQNYI